MPRYFTSRGLELFQARIREQRARVASGQREAGEAAGPSYDWHDNFGYEEARRRTEMEAARLQQLLAATAGAVVFDPPEQSDVIRIGNTVLYSSAGKDQEVTLGGYGELDPTAGLISYESPLGQALLGRRRGEMVHLEIDDKEVELLVKAILPPSYRYNEIIDRLTGTVQSPT